MIPTLATPAASDFWNTVTVTTNYDTPASVHCKQYDPSHGRASGNLAQGLPQTQLEERLTMPRRHGALYWWTVNVLARNRER
eukprot:3471653-Rhodomonas_salina.1